MNEHERLKELVPLYVAGQLDQPERAELEGHLARCAECQADHFIWTAVSTEISSTGQAIAAPSGLAERALERIHARPPLQTAFLRAWQLLTAQVMLVQHELWPACAAVMAIGVAVALLAEQEGVVHFIAPMVAAASLAVIYGPEHDPAAELALSTPTSAWKILLARLTLVSGYNLLLALIASLVMLAIIPPNLFGALILAWLGPLTFLSALALLLSLWIGTSGAITLAYGLWIVQYLQLPKPLDNVLLSSTWNAFSSAYQRFWQSPALLLVLSLILIVIALLSTKLPQRTLLQRMA